MGSEAESEEQLGERAPAGVPAIAVDKKGDPARWRDMSKPDRFAPDEITNVPEGTIMETPPGLGLGGEPAVESSTSHEDVSEADVG
jgi:hypothetical protein